MSGRTTHWCYMCNQSVRLRGRDTVCPNCDSGFVEELSNMVQASQMEFLNMVSDEDHERRFRLLDSISASRGLLNTAVANRCQNKVIPE